MILPSYRVRILTAGILVLMSGLSAVGQSRIETPFQVVSLWSDEMLSYLTGEKQTPCSGPNAANCKRIQSAVCDDVAYLASRPVGDDEHRRLFAATRQETRRFSLRIDGIATSSGGVDIHHLRSADQFDAMRLSYSCHYSGNEQACPAGRYQAGVIHRIELRDTERQRTMDLTPYAAVTPDGVITFRTDEKTRASLFGNAPTLFALRAVAECFSVLPSPVEWTFTLHAAPRADADSIGWLVSRVTAGKGHEFIYRSNDGSESPFTPDWVEHDWGYTYLMDQTMLDRRGDWVRLPPRPFPRDVWLRLPDAHVSTLEKGDIYTLSGPVSARRKDTGRIEALTGNVLVVAIAGRTLVIRKEQPADRACHGEDPPRQDLPQYVIGADALYDADLHLRLSPAYTRGC